MAKFKRKEGVKIGLSALLNDDSLDTLRVVSRPKDVPDDSSPAHVFLPKWQTSLTYPVDIICAFATSERTKGFVQKLIYKAIFVDEKIQEKNHRGPCMIGGEKTIKNDDYDIVLPQKIYIDYCVVLDALIEYIAEQNGVDPVPVSLYVYRYFGLGQKDYDTPNRFLVLCVLSQLSQIASHYPMESKKGQGVSYKNGAWFNFVVVKGWDYKKPFYIRAVVFNGLRISFHCGAHLTKKMADRLAVTADRMIGVGQTVYKQTAETSRFKLTQVFHCNSIPPSKFGDFVEEIS